MPTYCFYCIKCHKPFEKVLPMSESQATQYCECGNQGIRDIKAEHSHGNVDGLMAEHPRYSRALGVSETQIEEARKLHPGTEWKKFGYSYRPLIRNRIDKLRLMKEANFYEY